MASIEQIIAELQRHGVWNTDLDREDLANLDEAIHALRRIKAGRNRGPHGLDPFCGTGTTGGEG